MTEKKINGKGSPTKKRSSPSPIQHEFSQQLDIVKSLPGSVYWKDNEGKYLGCNDVMLEMAGMKSIIGKTDFDMPWSESAQTLRNDDLKVLTHNSPLEFEAHQTIASGELVFMLMKKAPLLDEQGNVIGIIGTSIDITHRKKHETNLRSTHEEIQSALENIVANMPGHVYWKDKNGVYLGCNNRQARSLGFRYGHEIIGKTDFDLPWGENKAELFRENDCRIMETGKTELIEEQAQVDGKNAIVLSHKSPMRNKTGEITGVLGISIDISDRKKLEADLLSAKEEAELASKAKTEFLENMRHDIRTPLTGIVGFSELLKMQSDSPHVKECADNLMASSHALLNLLDEVLEAIRVGSGEIPKLKKKFDLNKTLQHVIELNRAKAAEKGLELSLHFASDISKYVIGDKVRIHRVALELVANALNFTDSGYVKLSVKLAKKDKLDLVITLSVEDSGIGIPKDKQQEIYVQFKRLTPSYQGIYKGAGLGLAMVKQFVDELKAEIYVESEPKKGTRFTCFIPLQEPLIDSPLGIDDDIDEESEKFYQTTYTQQIKSPILNSEKKEYKILVVEDNLIAQSVAKSILEQLNCAVDIAENGRKAMDMWKANTYDLIFMDIGLPDLDGYKVTNHIRIQELPKKTHVPIIALTAHVGDEDKKRCIDAGMNAVLTKPLTAKSCADIVDAFIPGRQRKPPQQVSSSLGIDLPNTEEELFNLSHYPFLDIEEGVKTIGSKEMLFEMLKILIEGELQSDALKMKEAFAKKDFEKTQEFAHKIKGGAVYVGTVKMKMACQYLERYWKAGHRDLFEKLYEQTITVIDQTIEFIKKGLKYDRF